MMKKQLLFLSLLLTLISASNAQQKRAYNFSQEKMYAHINTTLLFPGEYLYYKLYCLDKEKNKLSSLSNIGYVELLGASGETVFKHRIVLEDGKGFNDFFVPTTIPSGNYKFIAYTQWMQNTGLADVFIADIKVINPYLSEKLKTTGIETSGVITRVENDNIFTEPSSASINKIDLKLNKTIYNKREKISLIIQNNIATSGLGNYSLSIRKVEDIPTFNTPKAISLTNSNFDRSGILNPNNMLPPETAGYYLNGRVLKINTLIPASNIDVSISIPGNDFYFTVKTTDINGAFSFTIDPEFPSEKAVIQVLETNSEDYKIILDEHPKTDFSSLTFNDFKIDISAKEAIKERSVFNQIENGFYTVKPDTLRATKSANSFVRYEKGTTYNLDDYKRFPTMTEVITEIMKIVYTSNGSDGNKVVKIVERKFSKPTNDLAMLFIDGVFIPDHNKFLAFDALRVDKIKFIRNGYVFGQTDYQGVVLVTTKDKNYIPQVNDINILKKNLFVPKKQKQYFRQIYTTKTAASLKRIPDYRLQLLWEPEIEVSIVNQQIEVYTSDVAGNYKIVLEGFTKNGTPVSTATYFTVED